MMKPVEIKLSVPMCQEVGKQAKRGEVPANYSCSDRIKGLISSLRQRLRLLKAQELPPVSVQGYTSRPIKSGLTRCAMSVLG